MFTKADLTKLLAGVPDDMPILIRSTEFVHVYISIKPTQIKVQELVQGMVPGILCPKEAYPDKPLVTAVTIDLD